MTSGIYEIRNMVNGHRYIGSSVNLHKREIKHFCELGKNTHHSSHLQRAYNLYGKDNFVFTVLYECLPEELTRCEQEELDLLKPEYNTCKRAYSSLGRKMSIDARNKVSLARRAWITTDEARENISKSKRGEKHPMYHKQFSEERKRRISLAKKGVPVSEEHKRKIAEAHKGKLASEETKKKMSVAHLGKIFTEETKNNMSLAQLGKHHTEETKKKLSAIVKKQWEERKAHTIVERGRL